MQEESPPMTLMNETFETVYATPLMNPNKGGPRPITTITDSKHILTPICKTACEFVGGRQVSPYFDCDFKIPYDTPFDVIKKLEQEKNTECLAVIKKLFEGHSVRVYRSKKACRVIKKKDVAHRKISLRYFVKGVKITNTNIKKLLESAGASADKPFDMSVYNDARILYLPYTSKPITPEDESATVLYPIIDGAEELDVFNYCATHVKADDIDMDHFFDADETYVKVQVSEASSEASDATSQDSEASGATCNSKLMDDLKELQYCMDDTDEVMGSVKKYIKGLSVKMADDRETWIKVAIALKSIAKKYDTHDKCLKIFKTFSMKSSKYDETDVIKTFTEVKLSKAKSIGLPTLKRMYEMCVYGDVIEDKTYEKVKEDFEKTVCKIKTGVMYLDVDRWGDRQLLVKGKLKDLYENKKCYVRGDEGQYTVVSFIDKWLNDENNLTYSKLDCDPSGLDKDGIYNTWSGFHADSLPPVVKEDVADLIKPIIKHLEEVITGTEHIGWLISFFASIIQRPHIKTCVAILVRGLQGSGKDIILSFFREMVLGNKISSQSGSLGALFDRFDNTCLNNVFTLVDEVNIKDLMGANNTNADKLKNLMVANTVSFEAKGMMKIEVRNYANLIFTSNNDNPVPIPHDDRRYVVFDTDPKYKGNTEYFKTLGKHLERDDVARAFYQYLKEYDISGITNFQDCRPITSYYKELKRLNLPVFYRFLSYMILCPGQYPAKEGLYDIHASKLYKRFTEWVGERNYTYTTNSTLFGKDVKKIIDADTEIICKIHTRDGHKYCMNLNKLKKYLVKYDLFDCDAN